MKNKITSRIMAALMTLMMILQAAMPATTVFAQEGGGKEEPSYQVKFTVTPEDAEITVKDGEDKEIEPSKEDKTVYELKEGSYKYSVSKEGYEAVKDEKLEVDKDQEVKVDLIKVKSDEKETESTIKEAEKKIEDEVEKLTPELFRAPAVGSKLSTTDIKTYSFDIIDGTHGGAKIDYKTQGDSGYNDYLSNPSKFNQPVGKDQIESELSLTVKFSYAGEEVIKEGDTLEIPASLGEELAAASFAEKKLIDADGNEIGTYTYDSGKFVLTFSGEHIKNNGVKAFSATVQSDSVKVPNTTSGTGTNGEKIAVYGKVMGSTIVAGYEKKNGNEPAGPGALSLDDVTIKSFKIIDVANGNKAIDYRTSDDPQYNEYKNDPSKFSNAICQNQSDSSIKLNMSLDYEGKNAIKEGDTLSIPMTYGGAIEKFASKPLFDSTNKQLGTWEYSDGKVKIKFAGDYIKNNQIKKFSASFETGEMKNYSLSQTKTTTLGERESKTGIVGKNDIVTPFEKFYVKAINVNDTTSNLFKAAIRTTDSVISWDLMIRSDFKTMDDKHYFAPYLMEHNGEYSPKALTDIYIEDTFIDCIKAPKLTANANVWLSGIDDQNRVISGAVATNMPTNLLTKVDQGSKSREEVKNSLKKGEYCVYDNHDETYTKMSKRLLKIRFLTTLNLFQLKTAEQKKTV